MLHSVSTHSASTPSNRDQASNARPFDELLVKLAAAHEHEVNQLRFELQRLRRVMEISNGDSTLPPARTAVSVICGDMSTAWMPAEMNAAPTRRRFSSTRVASGRFSIAESGPSCDSPTAAPISVTNADEASIEKLTLFQRVVPKAPVSLTISADPSPRASTQVVDHAPETPPQISRPIVPQSEPPGIVTAMEDSDSIVEDVHEKAPDSDEESDDPGIDSSQTQQTQRTASPPDLAADNVGSLASQSSGVSLRKLMAAVDSRVKLKQGTKESLKSKDGKDAFDTVTPNVRDTTLTATCSIGGTKRVATLGTLGNMKGRYPTMGGKGVRGVSFIEGYDAEEDEHNSHAHYNYHLRKDWTDVKEGDSTRDDVAGKVSVPTSVSNKILHKMRTNLSEKLANGSTSCMDKLVIEPNAGYNFAWDVVGAMLVMYDLMFFPLQAFNVDGKNLFVTIMNWIGTLFWTADTVRNFFVGYHNQGMLVQNFRMVARHYFKTWFAIDLMLVLLDWFLTVFMTTDGVEISTVQRLRLFRLLKLVRLMKVFYSIRSFEGRIMSERVAISVRIFKQIAAIIIMCHLIGCTWYAIGKASSGWADQFLNPDATFAYRYTSSFHWALTQFTPASIGIQPTNIEERSFGIVTLLFALIMFSLFLSGITNALQEFRNLSNAKARQLWILRKYLSQSSVPTEVAIRVQAYASSAWEARTRTLQEQEVRILELLSVPLRNELRTAIFEPRMVRHAFFMLLSKLAPLTMQEMCHAAVSRILVAPGDVLFHGGQLASKMFFLTGGNLLYDRHLSDGISSVNREMSGLMSDKVTELECGSWICEASLWVDWVHVGSLHSVTECDLVILDAVSFNEAVRTNMHTHHECLTYARGFVAGLNRAEKAMVTDLFMSGLLEGIWFRLLKEYNVTRRHNNRSASVGTSAKMREKLSWGMKSYLAPILPTRLMRAVLQEEEEQDETDQDM